MIEKTRLQLYHTCSVLKVRIGDAVSYVIEFDDLATDCSDHNSHQSGEQGDEQDEQRGTALTENDRQNLIELSSGDHSGVPVATLKNA